MSNTSNMARLAPKLTPMGVLPVPTASEVGAVRAGANITIDPVTGVITTTGGGGYVLPIATTTVLGGVMQGAGNVISGTGVLNNTFASLTTTGSGGTATLTSGVLNIPASSVYTLPIASATVLGGVKVGNNLTIDAGTGVLSANAQPLVPATTTTLGGVIVGDNLTVDVAGRISGPAPVRGQTLDFGSFTVSNANTLDMGGF